MTEGFDWLEAQHLLIENDELREQVGKLGLLVRNLHMILTKEQREWFDAKCVEIGIESDTSFVYESDIKFIDEPDSIRNDLQDDGYLLPVERKERDGAEHERCEGEAGKQ